MSAIASSRKYLPEAALLAFICTCLFAMRTTDFPTVPFHLIWASVTIMFGLRMWTRGPTWIAMGLIVLATGIALYETVGRPGGGGLDEMTEVPLMGSIFLITVWHVRKRQRATDEMRKMAERERSLLEAQRVFILDSAHSLRTPITIARGHAELLREEVAELVARDDVDVVIDELDRLARLSSRLLLLAASNNPDFLQLRAVPARVFVERCVARWETAAPARSWSWTLDHDGTLEMDEERMALALDAVIENAVKHTSDGGRIAIDARWTGTALSLVITDNGSGIPDDELPRVFDRFGRSRGPEGGTGLGLPIAQAIVLAHGGTIGVASDRRGTCVTIDVPRFAASSEAPAAAPAASLAG